MHAYFSNSSLEWWPCYESSKQIINNEKLSHVLDFISLKLTSGLSQPIISPYDTWWQRQYVGSLGSTGMSSTSEGWAIPANPGNTDAKPVSTPVSPANPPEAELVPEPDPVPPLELTPPFFCFFRAALTASSSEEPPPIRFFFSFSFSFLRPSESKINFKYSVL